MNPKHFFLTVLFLAISSMSVAQVDFKFERGYIINNRNERVNCLIMNLGSEESVVNYEYKLIDREKSKKIELSKVQEFGVEGDFKCVRSLIEVDISPSKISNMKDTLPQWEEGHAFLRVLVEGEAASLYTYYHDKTPRFFFSVENANITPLVHKKYYFEVAPNVVNQIFYDNTYKEQLNKHLMCKKMKGAEKIGYTKKDLANYFIDYNRCIGADYKEFKSAQSRKGLLFLKPSIGLNRTQLGIRDLMDSSPKTIFAKENSVGFGVEAEYVFPYNNYQWGVFTEVNYLSYKTDEILFYDMLNIDLYKGNNINYKSIEFPVGLAYYQHLSKNHRLYIKGAYVPHYIFSNSYIAYKSINKGFSSSPCFLFGLGYNYKRLAIEFRYYTPQNITQNLYKRDSDLTRLSFKISYALKLFGDNEVR